MINLFKLFLLLGLGGLVYIFIFRIKVGVFHRLLAVIIGSCLAIVVIFPKLSTIIAGWMGIGRGTDFIFYLSNLLIYYILVIQYLKLQKLKQKFVELTRLYALQSSKKI